MLKVFISKKIKYFKANKLKTIKYRAICNKEPKQKHFFTAQCSLLQIKIPRNENLFVKKKKV
jgi:hypothetical protein